MDKKPHIKPYLYAMLAGFGAISLSIIFFFLIYRFDGFGDFIQIHMPGDDFIIGGNDADERLADFLIGQTEGIEQRAVGGAFHALLDVFGQQGNSLLMLHYFQIRLRHLLANFPFWRILIWK